MNKPIPLNVLVSDREALLAVTLPLVGWAHSAEEVAEVADLAEATLDRMWMPKGKRKGITAVHTSKGPAAYSGQVIGTTVTLQRTADGWRINGFAHAYASSQRRGKLQLRISPKQEAAAFEAMHAACGIVVTGVASKAASAHGRSVRKGPAHSPSRRLKSAR
jgi:hypothetical protein